MECIGRGKENRWIKANYLLMYNAFRTNVWLLIMLSMFCIIRSRSQTQQKLPYTTKLIANSESFWFFGGGGTESAFTIYRNYYQTVLQSFHLFGSYHYQSNQSNWESIFLVWTFQMVSIASTKVFSCNFGINFATHKKNVFKCIYIRN